MGVISRVKIGEDYHDLHDYRISDGNIETWESKQDLIEDLEEIRNNAAFREIYKVYYNTTPFESISVALTSGSFPVCNLDNEAFIFSGERNGKYCFTTIQDKLVKELYVDSEWTSGSYSVDLTTKQDYIEDLETIRSGSFLGSTAVQEAPISNIQYVRRSGSWSEIAFPEETDPVFGSSAAANIRNTDIANWNNKGTVKSVNNVIPNTSGNVSIDIPDEDTVSGWGFTKNTGTYSKPSTGIPKSDLNISVQNSLNLADTAVQDEDISNLATKTELSNVEDKIPVVINNVTSTSTGSALSAQQGKLLNDRINNLQSIGRFLALWNCVTGLPLTNPSGYPYDYHTGDYFRISNIGTTNYMPSGSTYQGTRSWTVYTGGEVTVGDIWFYDGTTWALQINHVVDSVRDVLVNSASVVSSGVANIVVPTTLSALDDDSTHRVVTDTEKTTWNSKYSKPSGGIPVGDLSTTVSSSLALANSALQEELYKGTVTSVNGTGPDASGNVTVTAGCVVTIRTWQ